MLRVCLFVCLSALSVCMFVRLSVCVSALSLYDSVCLLYVDRPPILYFRFLKPELLFLNARPVFV